MRKKVKYESVLWLFRVDAYQFSHNLVLGDDGPSLLYISLIAFAEIYFALFLFFFFENFVDLHNGTTTWTRKGSLYSWQIMKLMWNSNNATAIVSSTAFSFFFFLHTFFFGDSASPHELPSVTACQSWPILV